MRLETKSLQVAPADEQSTIDTYQKFGWSVQNSQEIYSKDSHQEVKGGKLYSVTETTNYVKLTFQRDKDMEYYSEVVALEQRFLNLVVPTYKKSGLIKLGIILLIVGVIFCFASPIVGIILLLGAGASLFFGIKKSKEAKEVYNKRYQEYREAEAAIFQEVSAYV